MDAVPVGTPRSILSRQNSRDNRSTSITIVYITIEYCAADLFSGNGICARSHVRGLSKLGCRQHVIAGRPAPNPPPPVPAVDLPEGVSLHQIPLSVWRTTDRSADHQAFAHGTARILERLVRQFEPIDAILAVDWTGRAALDHMDISLRARLLQQAPLYFLNFRVYARMTDISDADRDFYIQEETKSVIQAIDSNGGVMSLSNADNEALRSLYPRALKDPSAFLVILPMLRDEFAQIAETDRDIILDTSRRRVYLICFVRLSEDKGPQRFVDICEAMTLADNSIWDRTGVIPLMAGASSQPEFAEALKARFKQVAPNAVIVDEFLKPAQLAQILQNSILNIHPACYEAYGMTIVEAAACGVPSITNSIGIGAVQILNPSDGASIAVDIEDIPSVARTVADLLRNRSQLCIMSHKAYQAATSWTEAEHVAKLRTFIDGRRATRKASIL